MATQFKSLASYANFDAAPPPEKPAKAPEVKQEEKPLPPPSPAPNLQGLGLVYRLEIHLPDTQNVETFRAIFRALREELMP